MASTLNLYNTRSRRKEEFEPLRPGEVRVYHCGPTVYNYAHIGNFRAFIFADVLRRYLEYRGFRVTQVMNLTDVGHMVHDADRGEDKVEAQARAEKKDPWQIAEFYTRCFFEDAEALGLAKAHHYPKATEHIPEMIRLIEALLRKGHAYVVRGSVYYDIASFPRYGELSGNPLQQLQAGARVEVHPDKRNPLDFALWISDPQHIMQWDSPWGRGYPGWHVECSAMAMKYLGPTLDIHTGGEDNLFPHHECEIAQSEAATGQPFVRCWMHVRFLLVDGHKMSKSLGNFYTLRDLLAKGHDPTAIRYQLLATHYRQPLNFTLEGIDAAKEAIRRLRDFRRGLQSRASSRVGGKGRDDPALPPVLERAARDFQTAMDDDLNTSAGTAAIFDMVREVNRLELGGAAAASALALLRRFDSVLSVLGDEGEVDQEVERLIQEREEARGRRDFARADEIRAALRARGIVLEDTPQGTQWKKL
jgi:cysteinyl-tRNA synthetase